ncbi:Heme NO binding protein [Tritonibacter multivorans]|uniref:Heme NO binding protein n=1 Tax=Tritonibacter multivorans TaxID=928856 RepID=A0A0P1GI98_9RHOB|nr:heme NO-binding domain-containing protein [Tritonibacter multivorans]MDA7419344.1 heme NO-binding domain-containing protein [Tritonibacter multivorans]CUH75275.1 Heme NO binding protein [Tritonibacter multivorans]SFD21831.1 Haem-NO-binding [Tritonibacter multivorans]
MHGLINRAIQAFVSKTYGEERWTEIMDDAGLGFTEFEAMLIYPDDQSQKMLAAVERNLERPLPEILEDLGTFLVSNPEVESLRRLLRFGGVNYSEFLHSLDDLPDRARLAVSDLHLPGLELDESSPGQFRLRCQAGIPGYAQVMMGVLRAMADDYGSLVMLDHEGLGEEGVEEIAITVVETEFAEGRAFELGANLL